MDTQDVVSLTLSAQDIEIYLLEEVKDNVDIVKSTDLSTKKDNLSLDNIKYGGLNISGINSSNIANKIKQIMNPFQKTV